MLVIEYAPEENEYNKSFLYCRSINWYIWLCFNTFSTPEYKFKNKDKIYNADECVGAGYEILPKYKEQFYPYIIYSNPELALDLVKKGLSNNDYQTLLLLRKGYKIRDFDYDNSYRCFATTQRAQKIFKNEDYKYI
jgi:hypothetical protein